MKRYIVGIDLGTTNSALAYVDVADPERRVHAFPVPQLVSAGTTALRPTLASFLYLGGEHDVAPGSLALPWDAERTYAVGEFARMQGARVPGHLITSAKSWLCHGGVDREAPILPWASTGEVAKLSPVEAASRYLLHFREAWAQQAPHAPLEEQQIILTVPASFDEVARELTVEAASRAGLPRVVLLEEPQAAFYAWIHEHETTWAADLGGVGLIVVIDIGGGTTDFSLIAVRRTDERLGFERLAVGDHLLLGGDNIDVALAHLLEPRLGTKLDSLRWHALVSLCRNAKETLLAPDAPEEVPVRLVGRGTAVVGGVLSATLYRREVEEIVLDGFFPIRDAAAAPRRAARGGLHEWGLPFANEPEVSRHLAAFLRQHAHDAGSDTAPTWPDAILFNGGALKPSLIRNRLQDLLSRWNTSSAPAVLQSVDLDLAVARGAAYYGLVRRGLGVRIAGGAARSYYIGLGAAAGSKGNADSETVTALCLVHRGMEEGEEIEIADPALEVVTNRGVSFPLYASSTRLGERAGQLVEAEGDSLTALPPIRTVLRFGKKLTERTIPVHILAALTEVGTLEVWCRSLTTDHRWRLQFQLRDQPATDRDEGATSNTQQAESSVSDERVDTACETLRAVFPADESPPNGDPVTLSRALEEVLGMGKDAWPLHTIRKLWNVLWEGQRQRSYSSAHEARWLNLSGFLLRPGFGAELDDWRIQQLWKIKSQGLCFPKAAQGRAEWWNMWKRIAGGLTRQQQVQLHSEVTPYLLPRLKGKAKGAARVGPQELREYWQLMASCERLSGEMKAELGEALLRTLLKRTPNETELWALGRFGARAPLYGPVNCVVPRRIAAAWVEALLAAEWSKPEALTFTLVQLARCVGDRERDLDAEVRERVANRVSSGPAGSRAAQLVREVVPLEGVERARILDESLPVGLQIKGPAGG
jgi:molecular chaperone DnaK (HSP70)